MSPTSTTHIATDPSDAAERPPRWRSKAVIGIGAVITMCGGIIAIDSALRDHDREVTSYDGPVTAVSVDVSGGSVTIVGGDSSTAGVEVDIDRGLWGPSHRETLEDGRLVISSNCPFAVLMRACTTDYVVHVPADVDVDLRGDGVDVDIVGVNGVVDVAIDGGNVDLAYDVAPTGLKARSNGGDIDINVPDDNDTQYRVDASTSGGSIDVEVRSDPTSSRVLDLHTNGGSISVVYGAET